MHNSFKIPFNFAPKYIFDIGANVGFASIYFRRRFPDSIIISVEPDASNFELLKKNTEKYKNIHCLQYGIWNKSTKLEIIENGNNKWNCRTVETTEGSHKASVPSITIDELMQMFNIEKIDILKMDIEGYEFQALKGATATLAARPIIITEINNFFHRYHENFETWVDFMTKHGYDLYALSAGQFERVSAKIVSAAQLPSSDDSNYWWLPR